VRDSERRNLDLQIELAHSNRVATMGQLSASIAHEVKQPITATAAYASAALRWLAARPPNIDEVRQALNQIVADSGRANDIVDRTRAFFKKKPRRKDHLDMNEVILELIAFMRVEADRHNVELVVQLSDRLPKVQGDRVQLQQVMLNLMVNALEAMSTTNMDERTLLIRTSMTDAAELCVTVHDSGPGLDVRHVHGVFDAFFTTKSTGMGMGLPICRSIVESHGGQIKAISNAPGGAIFQFTLPCAENEAPAGNAQP
jgi:C4-dicarboxylate-specific signal transduction histidine kinase